MAATMPHSIDLGDLVQDGVIGLIDAAQRFEESRGIKFETFAERRVRGAMIDALRKDAWPRGVRRVRRELEAAREKLRRSLGHEPSLADLAAAVGSDEKRLGKDDRAHQHDRVDLAAVVCRQRRRIAAARGARAGRSRSDPTPPTSASEVEDRVRAAIDTLPARERRVIGLYYYGEVTMKEIGAELGVNESRVSQLHARALRRLREALGPDCRRWRRSRRCGAPSLALRTPAAHGQGRHCRTSDTGRARGGRRSAPSAAAVVIDYASASRAARSKSPSRNGLASQRQPVSSRKRSASVPATSPVTKITRRASAGVAAAIAR